jgi:hypothetical protein
MMGIVFLTLTGRGEPNIDLPRVTFCGSWLPQMGFAAGALVQAIPQPYGISFALCDENIRSYSELARTTQEQSGKLIQVIFSKNRKNYGEMINTSGQYLLAGGLAKGDRLIAHYAYGLVRMRKVADKIGMVGSVIRHGRAVCVIRLFGPWLVEAGFIRDALVTAEAEADCITLRLPDQSVGQYSSLVKHARENQLQLLQPRLYTKDMGPFIELNGSALARAGFASGDLYSISSQYGLVRLQKVGLEDLGF